MKLLFIGGTGLLSSACAELALKRGHELTLLNRSKSRKLAPAAGAKVIKADVHASAEDLRRLLAGQQYDAVVDFIAFDEPDIERDLTLFHGATGQFVFISSASAYEKPPRHYVVTEETPLRNPFWQYSRDKIACEKRLMRAFRDDSFPVTIIRPSLTYGPTQIPFCVGSWEHPWTVIDRMQRGAKIVVPGDGTSLWVLTWNEDFAVGLIGLLGKPAAIGEAFQITSDQVLTWNQIYEEGFRALGLEPNILHVSTDLIAQYWPHAQGSLLGDKIHSAVFDNSKIKRFVPDYHCEVDWAHGLRKALEWHRAHPEFQAIDHEFERSMDAIVEASERWRPEEVR